MSTTFHDPIEVGESNSPDTINTRLGDIDAAVTSHASELTAAAGVYDNINDRFDSLVLAGGNIASFATVAAAAAQPIVNLDSATGFVEGARVAYALAGGSVEYNTIDSIGSFGVVTFGDDIGTGGIPEDGIVSMISESEYQAATALTSADTGVTRTLTTAITWLERQVNAKAFGAFGDGSSHLVGGGASLTAAQAKYPLTDAAFTITSSDEHDWCAIQETLLRSSADNASVERVYIPVGSYVVNRTLTVPMNSTDSGRQLIIEGAGRRGTTTSGTYIALTADTTLFLLPGATILRDMTLKGNTYTDSDSIAIRIGGKTTDDDAWTQTNSLHVEIERIYFQSGWYRCISAIYEVDQLHIKHCSAFGNVGQAAVYLSNDHNANSISPSAGVVIEQCHFSHTASTTGGECLYGVYLMGTENSVIRNSVIRGYDHMIYLDGATGSRNYNLHINGIHSEINTNLKTYTSARWTPNTAYSVGNIIRPMASNGNGWFYRCTTAGTTAANSIRNSTYEWTASTRGTSEYYLQLASAGGDPSVTEPFGVMENGTAMTFGWAGRLSAGQWGFGDVDSLGYTTIYVRLTDSTDPDGKATHYLWTSANEPTWPTTYGATVADSGAVWTAHKRAVFCELSSSGDASIGGLRISGVYCDAFSTFVRVNTSAAGSVRVAVDNCTVLTCGMIYSTANNVRASFMAENGQLDGSIRPYATLTADNAQTAVMLRFVKRSNDLVGALGNAENGISTWFTGEINSSYTTVSQLQVNDVNATIDLINHAQVIVSTDSAVVVYVPRITSTAWVNGLLGRQYSIVHGDGTENMTLQFTSVQPVLHGDGAPTSLAMNDIGDAATIKLGVRSGGPVRWFLAGSYGI